MVAKILAGVALFFSLVAIVLKSVALSVPHFVDVHLTDDPNNANDGNRLGGVGVFQSEFNSDLEGDVRTDIESENIPIIDINTPTTEYPLLFPGQENFIADVLPINRELLASLEGTITGISSNVDEELTDVENLQLEDNCGEFVEEADSAVLDFFTAFQGELLPQAIAFISGAIPVLTAQTLAGAIQDAVGASFSLVQGNALGAFANEGLVDLALLDAACTGVTLAVDTPIDANSRACFTEFFNVALAETSNPLFNYPLALVSDDTACPNDSLIATCLTNSADRFELIDGPFNAAATFVDASAPAICGLIIADCSTKEAYLGGLALIVANVPVVGPLLEQAITQYIALVNAVSDTNLAITFADGFPTWPQPAPENIPFDVTQTGAQPYQPCISLAPLNVACATLEEYFVVLPAFLEESENPLAPTVAGIAALYEEFFASGAPLGAAPTGFKNSLISGAFNDDFQLATFTAEFTQACEDDLEDLEKIEQAQALAIASTIFEALSLLLIIVGIILPVDKLAGIAPAAAVTSILGGVFILSALFVVESAPIYDGVGAEADGSGDPEIFFIQGYVPLLALVDAVLFFLGAVTLIATTVFACKEKNGADVGAVDDLKADAPMEDKI